MPNIWVCKTGSARKPSAVGAEYSSLVKRGIGGHSLPQINPCDFESERELSEHLDERLRKHYRDKYGAHVSGRTFGKQMWQIAKEVKPGDWFFLECPSAGDKGARDPSLAPGKAGPQKTFIVAAGIVSGCYRFKPKSDCIHQVKVDWKWKGMERIDYPFQMMTFVKIDESRPEILARLRSIFSTQQQGTTQAASPQPDVLATHREYDSSREEGDVVLKAHRKIERSQAATREAKRIARENNGNVITCACCAKTPELIYGVEIIDAHHKLPLAKTKGTKRETKPDDFEMLCPTCHRAVHSELSRGNSDAVATIRRKLRTADR